MGGTGVPVCVPVSPFKSFFSHVMYSSLLQSNALFGLSLAGGIAGYAYLSFVELSWDIMEPVTYLTGTAVTFVGKAPMKCQMLG